MARSIGVTSVYLITVWLLMFSYQVFTQTALTTVISSFRVSAPLASWLTSRIDLAAFVVSFAWMFVLSSIISNLIFGKEKRLFIQFFISLALTVTSTILFEALKGNGLDLTNPNTVFYNIYTQVFSNAFFAFFYLCLPFIFMLFIDVRTIIKKKR